MAGQDYPKRLEAGATQNVNIAGDYIFCKFADRPFTVIMDGSRVTMEGGDKYRNSGGFTEFEIENTDPLNPIAIILTIGQGDYNRQIVKGEITTVTGVRKADGRFVDDSRVSLSMNIKPIYGYGGETVEVGDATGNLAILGLTGTDFNGSIFGDLKYYEGALLVRIDGSVPDRRKLISIDLALGGYNIVPLPNDWFNDDTISKFAVCEELPGGFIVNNTTSGRRNRLRYYEVGSDSLVEFVSAPRDILWIEYRNDTKELYVAGDSGGFGDVIVRVYNLNGSVASFNRDINLNDLVFDATTVRSDHCFFNRESLAWTHCANKRGSGLNVATTDGNFDVIESYDIDPKGGTSSSGGNTNYNVLVGESFYGWSISDELFYESAAIETELTMRGFASRVGCDVSLIDPRYDNFATSAKITTEDKFGRVKVSGELIKAALELYYRKPLASGYMDSVFDVTIYTPASSSLIESIGGRSITLAALEVVDNFKAYLPGRLDITIDANIKFAS
jgi:hypothetical protein